MTICLRQGSKDRYAFALDLYLTTMRLQILETSTEIRLLQFFISPEHQGVGIGTEVLSRLVTTWNESGKPIMLTVLKNNPARRLYERFAFSVVGEVGVKFEMKR